MEYLSESGFSGFGDFRDRNELFISSYYPVIPAFYFGFLLFILSILKSFKS